MTIAAKSPGPASILVATDFSSPGSRATDFAAALASARGAPLCLLHVFEPSSMKVPELALDPGLENDLRHRANAQLAVAATTLRARGLTVEERLLVGSPPAEVIADLASKMDPVLVVLGSHGRRPVPRLLMGSVAEGALLRIRQPVMVVPDGIAGGSPPPPPPTSRPWRFAVGLDQSNTSAAAIDWIRDLRRHADFDVTFIHLYWPAAEYARFGLQGPRDLFEPDPVTIELLRKSLSPLIADLPGRGQVSLRIVPSWGSIGQRLTDEAAQAQADLLVVGTHHRGGFSALLHGSTVPPAIHAGTLPIVCVSRSPRHQPSSSSIPHLRSIVAATDLSELGNRAIPHAYALARAEHGVVHLLHVHERLVPRPAYAYAPDSANALTIDETDKLRAQLHALIPAQATAHEIATDVIIADGGGAAEVICQTAERYDADAICLASHGRGGLGRLVLGSVAGQVLHQATRPVFLVRSPLR
jgi:nucleotide-binding universal stress UspA family protein